MGDDGRISLPRRLQNVYHGNNFLTIFFTNSNLLCTCPGIQIPSRPVAVPKHTDNALIDFTHAFQITDVSSHLKCSAWHFFSQLKRMYVYLATIGMGRVISGPRTRRPLPHNDPNPLAVKLPKAKSPSRLAWGWSHEEIATRGPPRLPVTDVHHSPITGLNHIISFGLFQIIVISLQGGLGPNPTSSTVKRVLARHVLIIPRHNPRSRLTATSMF